MKILIWGMSPNLGGVETYLMNFLREIPEDIIVDFICPYKHMAFENEISNRENSRVRYITRNKLRALRVMRDIKTILMDRYDIVYINISGPLNSSTIFMNYARRYTDNVIVHSHANQGFKIDEGSYFRKSLKKSATALWACSSEAGKWLFGDKLLEQVEFQVIPNAIDVEKFKFNTDYRYEIRKELNIEEKTIIGMVGRLTEVKNQESIIRLMPKILEKSPSAILMIIGEGELHDRLSSIAKEENVDDKVVFLGKKEDVYRYYSAMDCFVLSSLNEGFPMTVVEAQSNGCTTFLNDRISKEVDLCELVHYYHELEIVSMIEQMQLLDSVERVKFNDLLIKTGYNIVNNVDNILNLMGGYLDGLN